MKNASLNEILKVLVLVEKAKEKDPDVAKALIDTTQSIEELVTKLAELENAKTESSLEYSGIEITEHCLSIPSVTGSTVVLTIAGIVAVEPTDTSCTIHLISGIKFKFTTQDAGVNLDRKVSPSVLSELHDYFLS